MYTYIHYITLHYITLHLHYIYITFTLHLQSIYITFTLHLHYITLHLHYIYITFTIHVHYIYITFTLHLHYIYITLHLHYIYITFTLHLHYTYIKLHYIPLHCITHIFIRRVQASNISSSALEVKDSSSRFAPCHSSGLGISVPSFCRFFPTSASWKFATRMDCYSEVTPI